MYIIGVFIRIYSALPFILLGYYVYMYSTSGTAVVPDRDRCRIKVDYYW